MNAVLIRSNGLTVSFQCETEAAFFHDAARDIRRATAWGLQPIVRAFMSDGAALREYSIDEVLRGAARSETQPRAGKAPE